MKLGFIGLGIMGAGMARTLLAAGYNVKVFNRTLSKAKVFADAGARIATDVEEIARDTDILITMLADDQAIESVIQNNPNFLPALPKKAVHIAMGTISVAQSQRLEEAHASYGHHFIAAPVLGRGDIAASGQLAIIAGGDEEVVQSCQPLFDVMGRRTFYTGSRPYAANIVKLCMNFMLAAAIESMGEAFAVIRKANVDTDLFLDLMTSTLFPSPVHQIYGAMQASDDYSSANFTVPLGLKDVTLAAQAAEHLNVPLPTAGVIRDQLISALAHNEADQDWSVVGRVAMRNAGFRTKN